LSERRIEAELEVAQQMEVYKTVPVVQTGWIYASASPGAPAATAQDQEHDATARRPVTKSTMYEICRAVGAGDGLRGIRGVLIYISGIMRRANINDEDYINAFATFLATKYGRQTSPEVGTGRRGPRRRKASTCG
jgi:hypothetical protein